MCACLCNSMGFGMDQNLLASIRAVKGPACSVSVDALLEQPLMPDLADGQQSYLNISAFGC